MIPLTALWLPILVSAVFVFIASSVIHMMLGYHKAYYGTLPEGALDRFQGILEDDPRWVLSYQSDETVVFRLDLTTETPVDTTPTRKG